jgi:hypothetical protein
MATEIEGAIELRKAIKKYAPNLGKETTKEIGRVLRPLVAKAKGFVPSQAPLSGWANPVGEWSYRVYDASDIRRGITFSSAPSKPNRKGFRALVRIINKSAAGEIYEWAGRVNPQGRPWDPQSSSKDLSHSANRNAGKQFIDAIDATGQMSQANQSTGRGRRGRYAKGRLIFRAWAEDQGKANAAVLKAIDTANRDFASIAGEGVKAA